MKTAVFPGSFDPITIGHVDIIHRALSMFDRIYLSIGVNSDKTPFFDLELRKSWLNEIFKEEDRVIVSHYSGLTVDYCQSIGARFILRGLRSSGDFEFEKTIAQLNHSLNSRIETFFLISQPQYAHISSTIVREIVKYGGDVSSFIPDQVKW